LIAKKMLYQVLRRFSMVIVVQGVVGYLQYFLGVPIGLVAVHVAVSVLVWLCALDIYWNSRLSVMPTNVLD
ncbi:hypothetical protein EB083_02770, partial [bacterium]|nr:hypothetical protein [bacterium]